MISPLAGAVTTAFTGASAGQCGKRWADEIHDVLLFILRQLDEATADTSLRDPRARRPLHLSRPASEGGTPSRAAGHAREAGRHPVGDDVVIGLVGCCSCTSSTRPGSPVAYRLIQALGRNS